jgi:hypothetical protein
MNHEAARAVARLEQYTPQERHELLDMLGLLDETGRAVRPDPSEDAQRVINAKLGDLADRVTTTATKGRMAKIYDEPPVARAELPVGLRLTPAERDQLYGPPPKPKRQPKPKAKPTSTRRGRPVGSGRNPDLLPPTTDEFCGTLTGRNRHARRGESMCDPCRERYNAWQREFKDKRRAATGGSKRKPAQCGTPSGARAHRRKGEEVCQPCLEARRADGRRQWYEREAKRKAAEAAAAGGADVGLADLITAPLADAFDQAVGQAS